MNDVVFAFEWEDPRGARGDELRATWARLQVVVAGQNVTQLIDDRSRGVRDAVYLPLYPVAEWLATHWWLLAYEPEVPGRADALSYEKRHSLRYAGEGFALPDLSMRPVGGAMRLVWQRSRRPAQQVEFLNSGAATVDASTFRSAARALIEGVRRRLREQHVEETPLDREWEAIQGADADEVEFCAAAASLGADPYAIGGAERDAIVQAHTRLPRTVTSAFFDAADLASLASQVEAVTTALRYADEQPRDRQFLFDVRDELNAPSAAPISASAAWVDGYALAQRLRATRGLNGEPIPDLRALATSLGARDPHALDPVVPAVLPAHGPFNAVLSVSHARGPGFAVDPRGHAAQRFAICRVLYEFFTSADDAPRLVTRARTTSQQRNRAFAAEFLAPVAAISARLRGPDAPDDEVDELAAHFGVSPLVVKHQLDNHRLPAAPPLRR